MSWQENADAYSKQPSGEGWLDRFLSDASKTLAVGTSANHKVSVPHMAVGHCPICKVRVERPDTDIYFPYCSYKHKREVQRIQEEEERKELERRERRDYERRQKDLAKQREKRHAQREESMCANLRAYIKLAEEKQALYMRRAAEAPKCGRARELASRRAKKWYQNLIDAKRELQKREEAQNERKSTV